MYLQLRCSSDIVIQALEVGTGLKPRRRESLSRTEAHVPRQHPIEELNREGWPHGFDRFEDGTNIVSLEGTKPPGIEKRHGNNIL